MKQCFLSQTSFLALIGPFLALFEPFLVLFGPFLAFLDKEPLWAFFEILFLGLIKTFYEPNVDCCNLFRFLKSRCYAWIKVLSACLDPLTFVGMEDLLHSYDLSFVEGRRETISFGFFWRYSPSIFPLPSAHCGDCRDAIKGGRGHNHQGCIQKTFPLKHSMVYVKSVMCDEFVPACKLVILGHMQVCIDHPTYFQHPRKCSAVMYHPLAQLVP